MTAEVVIPIRTDDPDRLRALEWVEARIHELPDVWISYGGDFDGPWCKARAVAEGVAQTSADVLVISDADVWCDGLTDAIAAVEAGATWSVPHRAVHRLTKQATAEVLAGAPFDSALPLEQRPYLGHAGGGIVAIRADVYRVCPLDPRFVGWGQEDDSWCDALTALHGPPWRGHLPLWHLWHTPQERKTRIVGSDASLRLRNRYKAARRRPHAMEALLAEIPLQVAS